MVFVIISFIIGLLIGSFVNAYLYRTEKKVTLGGRSFCPKCKRTIRWYDLFPVFSYLLLGGRCRDCKKTISIQYPLVELFTGLIFAGTAYKTFVGSMLTGFINGSIAFPYVSLISYLLLLTIFTIAIIIMIYDLRTGYILSRLAYIAALLVFIYLMFIYGSQDITLYYPHIISALAYGGLFLSLYLYSKGKWMGAGDSEIGFLIGLFLGYPLVVVGAYFAFLVGSIFGLFQIFRKKAELKSQVPFAPFLVGGLFFAYFFGDQLIRLYVKIFLGG